MPAVARLLDRPHAPSAAPPAVPPDLSSPRGASSRSSCTGWPTTTAHDGAHRSDQTYKQNSLLLVGRRRTHNGAWDPGLVDQHLEKRLAGVTSATARSGTGLVQDLRLDELAQEQGRSLWGNPESVHDDAHRHDGVAEQQVDHLRGAAALSAKSGSELLTQVDKSSAR